MGSQLANPAPERHAVELPANAAHAAARPISQRQSKKRSFHYRLNGIIIHHKRGSMSLLRGRLLWTGLATLFALLPSGLSAQSTFATVTGTVTDPAGAVIPGVKLTATHIETNIKTTAQSNEAGVYTIAQLKEGDYTLRAQGAGFKEFVVQNVVLQARDYRRVDIHLEVGGVETKIEVTSGATLIETETARISDSKDANLLKALPLNTRSLYSYLALSPNVLSAGFGLSYRRFAGSRGN